MVIDDREEMPFIRAQTATYEERTLDGLMSALPEEQREVLVLREIEELDYRQIATITNIPIGTVMSRLARARAALKARWLLEAKGHPHAVR
jgi:RNA polymerase sigma-70 factor, ECF subfamily